MIATIIGVQELKRKMEQEKIASAQQNQRNDMPLNLSIPMKKWYLPIGHPGRPGTKLQYLQGVTIHDTGNLTPGSTARANCKYVHKHVAAMNKKVSFHWCVDDKEAILLAPMDEVTFHGSCGTANKTTISIEICVAKGMNWRVVHDNAVVLTAWILRDVMKVPRGQKINKYLFTHSDWIKFAKVKTDKICPRQMLQNGLPYPYETFVNKVNKFFI